MTFLLLATSSQILHDRGVADGSARQKRMKCQILYILFIDLHRYRS